MIGVANVRSDDERLDVGESAERVVVHAGDLAAPREADRERVELAQSERALKVAQAVIIAEAFHVVAPRLLFAALAMVRVDAVAAKAPHLLGRAPIGGRNHAALAGRDVLDGMKAEHGEIGDRADFFILVFGAESVTRVADER